MSFFIKANHFVRSMFSKWFSITAFIFILGCYFQDSYSQGAKIFEMRDTVPLNPLAKVGALSNGMTYYLSRNEIDSGKVLLFLTIKTGFFNQEKDQYEVAHLLEHVLINRGSTHFPEDSLKKFTLAYGIEQNAFTAFEYTTYYFSMPSNFDAIKGILLAFKDWIEGEVLLSDVAVDTEKDIVFRELVGKRGCNAYKDVDAWMTSLEEKSIPSLFSDRDSVLQVSNNRVRDFYKKWYKPDRSGVLIVGDISVVSIEEMIRGVFFDGSENIFPVQIKNAYKNIDLPGEDRFLKHDFQNDVRCSSLLRIYLKESWTPDVTYGNYKECLVRELCDLMIRYRIIDIYGEERIKPNINFDYSLMNAVRGVSFCVQGFDSLTYEHGFRALLIELERLRRFGFSEEELDRGKVGLLATQKWGANSNWLEVLRYNNHFVFGNAAPSAVFDSHIKQWLLTEITQEYLNKLVSDWLNSDDLDIVAICSDGLSGFFCNAYRDWDRECLLYGEKIERYVFKSNSVDLYLDSLYSSLKPVTYTMKNLKGLGVVELNIEGGPKVILRQDDSSNSDKIYFEAFRSGGTLSYQGCRYSAARIAETLVEQAGLGEMDRRSINYYLTEHGIRLGSYIDEQFSGIKGSAANDDFECLLKLMCLHFLPPKRDIDKYDDWLSKWKRRLITSVNSYVGYDLDDIVGFNISQGSIPFLVRNEITVELCLEIYKACFSRPEEFTFVFTGVKDMEKTIHLISQYLGNIPNEIERADMETADVQLKDFRGGVTKYVVNEELVDKSDVFLVFLSQSELKSGEQIKVKILSDILRKVLQRKIRDEEGGTYGVYDFVKKMKCVSGEHVFVLGVYFSCDPDQVQRYIKMSIQEIENIRENGVDSIMLESVARSLRVFYPSKKLSSRQWLSYFVNSYQDGFFEDLSMRDELLNSITSENIREGALDYLCQDCLVKCIEVPAFE